MASGTSGLEDSRQQARAPGVGFAVAANAWILGMLAATAGLNAWAPDLFYRSVQEDEWLEWATFWAFVAASAGWALVAARAAGAERWRAWFPAGVALFCALVALEEISWGQRLLGFRPPAYFLEQNYQQELNLHNVLRREWRVAGLKAVILGFGVVLPMLGALRPAGHLLGRVGLLAPPLALVPAFLATWWIYQTYPFRFSGEVTELMLGLSFLFTALAWLARLPARSGFGRRPTGALLLLAGGVLALGVATVAASRWGSASAPERVAAARRELEALRADLREEARRIGRLPSRCGLHKRLYTYRREYRRDHLDAGAFAALRARGLPDARAAYFLDPWNSPYWIRDSCGAGASERVVFLYSFGPNRRRDSSPGRLAGDDVGVVLLGAQGGAEDRGSSPR